MIASFIALIIFIVFSRLVGGRGVFGALKRLESRLLRSGKIPIENFFFDMFIYLRGGLMAL